MSLTDPGTASPAPCWTPQQDRWSHPPPQKSGPCPQKIPIPHQRHERAAGSQWHGCLRADFSPLLRGLEAQTDHLSYHPDPHLTLALAHSSIYAICDTLECVKGLVLQSGSHRIPMTQGSSAISKCDFSEGPVIMVCVSEALNQSNNSWRGAVNGAD